MMPCSLRMGGFGAPMLVRPYPNVLWCSTPLLVFRPRAGASYCSDRHGLVTDFDPQDRSRLLELGCAEIAVME